MASPPGSPEPRRPGEAPRHRSGNRGRPVVDDDDSSEGSLINTGNRASLGSLQEVRAALLARGSGNESASSASSIEDDPMTWPDDAALARERAEQSARLADGNSPPAIAARDLGSRPPIVADVGGLEPSVPLVLFLVGKSLGR